MAPDHPGGITRAMACGGAGANLLRELMAACPIEGTVVDVMPHRDLPSIRCVGPETLREVARVGDLAMAHSDEVRGLKGLLKGADIAFVLAGLGGKTGTWATPLACHAARSQGILTLPIVTIPMRVEGHHRLEAAMEALPLVMGHADLTTTFAIDRLMKLLKRAPMAKAFQAMNRILATSVVTLNAAFARSDVGLLREYFGHKREGRLGLGRGSGAHPALEAVEEAFQSPWFDANLEKVEKGIAVVEGAEPDSTAEKDVMRHVGRRLPTADILYATGPAQGPGLRVTLLLAL